MTSHLSWMIIRDNSAFLLKKRGVKKPFSTVRNCVDSVLLLVPSKLETVFFMHNSYLVFQESNNLANVNSFRYNGLVHKKTIGIAAAPDNKGFTVTIKKAKSHVSSLVMWCMCSHSYELTLIPLVYLVAQACQVSGQDYLQSWCPSVSPQAEEVGQMQQVPRRTGQGKFVSIYLFVFVVHGYLFFFLWVGI